jgi:kynurenine formamidase
MPTPSTSLSLTLPQMLEYLKTRRWVDMTHAFAPGIPHWPGFPDEERETIYHYDEGVGSRGTGIYVHRYSHVGQWGTHADPPAHFVKGLRTLDQIDVKEMILPLVVLDIHAQVARDPDYQVALDDVTAWESRHGQLPAGSFVALRTDWSKRWPDDAALQNKDAHGVAHFPGWSREVLTFLFEVRGIAACGHETTDTNPGLDCSRGDYSLETYVLSTDHYQVELLDNLDQVPETGAIVVATFPKPKHGTGFPARVFAILP